MDFPFAKVPIPRVTYLNDSKVIITFKCDFDVPPGNNVTFEIQWFINGKGLRPAPCDNPGTSNCGQLKKSEYSLGDQVLLFFPSSNAERNVENLHKDFQNTKLQHRMLNVCT